jgi:hypothetical protein
MFQLGLLVLGVGLFAWLLVMRVRRCEAEERERELWRRGGIVSGVDLGGEPSRGCISYFSEGRCVRVEQLVARRSHKPKVAGSSPAPATNLKGGVS